MTRCEFTVFGHLFFSAVLACGLQTLSARADEPLPVTDRSLAAFFRFDNTSAWGRDSGTWMSRLSGTTGSSSAGLKTGDGSLGNAGCLNLPFKVSGSLIQSYSPSYANGNLGGAIPNLADPSQGWTIAMWVRLDKDIMNRKVDIHGMSLDVTLKLLMEAAKLNPDLKEKIAPYEALIDSDVWNHVALTYNPDCPTTNNAYTVYLNCGAGGGDSGVSEIMRGGTQKGVCPYTLPFSIDGPTLTLGGYLGTDLEEPIELDLGLLGKKTISGLTVMCAGRLDDVAIFNRCLTSNEVARLASAGETYVWLTKGDEAGKCSFSENHNWSGTASGFASLPPQPDLDYLVDLGDAAFVCTPTTPNLSSTFGGQSLTLGRLGGAAGGFYHLGDGSTAAVGDFRINNGTIKVGAANATLTGRVSLKATAARPLLVCSDGSAASYNWAVDLEGDRATAIRVAAGNAGSLEFRCSGNLSQFGGELVIDGANTVLKIKPETFANMEATAISLKAGATLKPFADGDSLRSNSKSLLSDGMAVIDVPKGETLVLAAQIAGAFVKKGEGTLVLQPSGGDGKVGLSEGTMRVVPGFERYLGSVNGGTLMSAADEYVKADFADVAFQGPMTLALRADDSTGDGDAMTVGIVDTSAGPLSLEVAGTFATKRSYALLKVRTPVQPLTANDFRLQAETKPGFETALRVETDEPDDLGMQTETVWMDIRESERYVIAQDTFEAFKVGTAAPDIAGWTGTGAVAAGSPFIADPPSYRLPEVSHERTLETDDCVIRTYDGNFVRDNQILDLLVQVVRTTLTDGTSVAGAGSDYRILTAVNESGRLCIYHPGEDGVGKWTPLDFGPNGTFEDDEWIRLLIVFDYHSNPSGKTYVQIRANGSCGVSPDGVRSPTDTRANGSWFPTFNDTVLPKMLRSVTLTGEGKLDDVVVSAYGKHLKPEVYSGTVTSTNYSTVDGQGRTVSGTIPYSACDDRGIPRDLHGDSDGDGFADGLELLKGSDPLDASSCPGHGLIFFLR